MSKTTWWKAVATCLLAWTAVQAEEQPGVQDSPRAGNSAGTKTPGNRAPEVHRLSYLMNHPVLNNQNEKLGVIKDVVITEMGKPRYVIIDHGGALQDKYVAVPWSVMQQIGRAHV